MTTEKKVSLLPADMPDGKALVAEGRNAGDEFEMGISLLCEEHGVRSEPEYRKKMVKEGRLMTAMNIGLQTWQDTAEALKTIYDETKRRGFRIDRYQMQVDRRMGLPPELWGRAAKETGPMLVTDEDWLATTRTVPIQAHLGDMMIGSPMSFINAQKALKAGVNYIGNMGQFAWKYPAWQGDDVAQMSEMVKALGLMASKADEGATMQSYLEDGYSAQFHDYCSYVGWALFERYIVKKVIGARLSISFGGLTHNPVMKMAMILALESIKPKDTITAFYGCNTTAYTPDIQRNYAVLVIDVLYLMMAQLRTQSATTVIPIPVTEALRVPSWQEIVEVHTIARRIAEDAKRLMETIDWASIEKIRDRLLEGGRQFYDNIMKGLSELGVDMEDPLQLLLAVRRLGAVEIESRFGVGEQPKSKSESYQPVIPTDTLQDFINQKNRILVEFSGKETQVQQNAKIIVGSTDVHEYGMLLVVEALQSLGIEPIVAGINVDPDEFADLALEAGATVILISTHNGMALTYAEQLLHEFKQRRLSIPIGMGGTLNQDFEGQPTPVDVRDDLIQLGIFVCNDVPDMMSFLNKDKYWN